MFHNLAAGCRALPAVFRDAADEYGSLPAVKRRLEEWKAQQPGEAGLRVGPAHCWYHPHTAPV